MYRNIINQLEHWRLKPGRKPLVLMGARQIGKTYSLKDFGLGSFKQLHYINFDEEPRYSKIFEQSLNPHKILEALKLDLGLKIIAGEDLLVFDEIQECPKALSSLKYFCEQMPELHVIAAGSLLGLSMGASSYPVGKVDQLNMYPMTFAEFLRALNKNDYLSLIEQRYSEIDELAHDSLWQLLKYYFVIGGLPEVVEQFSTYYPHDISAGLEAARIKQRELINAYNSDIAKHSGKVNSMQIEDLLVSAAVQLGQGLDGGSTKFKIKNVTPKIKEYSRLENALNWLLNTALLIKCPIIEDARQPLIAQVKANRFKLFVFDVGILGALVRLNPNNIIDYDYGTYKGFFAENFIAQELVAASADSEILYCWQGQESEIEFVVDFAGKLVPIEVKSGTSIRSHSLNAYSQKYQPETKVLLSARPYAVSKQSESTLLKLPLYLAGTLAAFTGCKKI